MLDIKKFSTGYQVKTLQPKDADHVLNLVRSNSNYYNFCPPQPTRHSILEDMKVVPADKTMADKFFVGFYQEGKLLAILDLISSYPDNKSIWLGFFMVDAKYQGKGIGSRIINDVLLNVKNSGFKRAELAYAKGNNKSEKFLLKNGFVKDGREIPVSGYTVVVMNKEL